MLDNDYHPDQDPANDLYKPSRMFDRNPTTLYHSRSPSNSPGVNIYFGAKYTISKIKFIPFYYYSLDNNENTIFSILKEDGKEENCGILTGTNTESASIEDQTYEISCLNKEGVGLRVWKNTTETWTVAVIEISYSDRELNLLNNCKSFDDSVMGIEFSIF